MKIVTLKRPAEFRRVRGGLRWATPLFIIEGRKRTEPTVAVPTMAAGPRFGFTITRKVGGAVVRNHIRRRLKEALRTLGTPILRADHDYVLVASRSVHDYPFAGLQHALREAFERLHRQAETRVAGRDSRRAAMQTGAVPAAGRPQLTDGGSGTGPEPRSPTAPDTSATRERPRRASRRHRR